MCDPDLPVFHKSGGVSAAGGSVCLAGVEAVGEAAGASLRCWRWKAVGTEEGTCQEHIPSQPLLGATGVVGGVCVGGCWLMAWTPAPGKRGLAGCSRVTLVVGGTRCCGLLGLLMHGKGLH